MKNNNEAYQLAKYISDFLNYYAPSFLTTSQCTIKSYKDALILYVTYLAEKEITPNQFNRKYFERDYIEGWISWLKEKRGCCPDTCNVRLASIRVFLGYLGARDVELLYLCQQAKQVKRQKTSKKKVTGLTRDAVSAMLEAPDLNTRTGKRDIVFLTLLYATAGRLDEIRSIKISHINLSADKPYINLHGKGDKIRTSYLLPRAVAHLKVYLKEFHGDAPKPDDYLFYSRVGSNKGKLTEAALDKRIKKYAKKAHEKCPNVPLNTHAHQFRHAKASHWIEDGLSVVQVSFLLGHSNLETTMKYLDITTEDKIKALSTLENEAEKKVSKKWKKTDGSLMDFCGLKR